MFAEINGILVSDSLVSLGGAGTAWRASGYIGIADGLLSAEVPRLRGPSLDASGLIVLHGFIDIHTHGCGQSRFFGLNNYAEAVDMLGAAQRLMARAGVVGFLATTLTEASPDGAAHLLRAVSDLTSDRRLRPGPGANVLGSHAEGPFLAAGACGAHDAGGLLPATPTEIHRLLEAGGRGLRIVTAAPEVEGFEDLCRIAAARGITVSIGHTDLSGREDFERAVDAGAQGVTHLFNAMGGIHHRRDNVAALALGDTRVYAEVVFNPHFVSESWQDVALRSKGPARVIAVSDCIGDLDPMTCFNGTPVQRSDYGYVRTTDGAPWGVHTQILDAVPALRRLGLSWPQIERLTSLNAVDNLSLKSFGVAPGSRANLVVLDEAGGLQATVVDGRLEFLRDMRRVI